MKVAGANGEDLFVVFRVIERTPLGAVVDLVGVYNFDKPANELEGPAGLGFISIPVAINETKFRPIYGNERPTP